MISLADHRNLSLSANDGFVSCIRSSHIRQKINASECGPAKESTGFGIDLNRNFDVEFFTEEIRETDPCSETFQGPAPFSAPETKALRKIINRHVTNLYLYVALHSFGQIVIHPWSSSKEDFRYKEEAAALAQEVRKLSIEFMSVFSQNPVSGC